VTCSHSRRSLYRNPIVAPNLETARLNMIECSLQNQVLSSFKTFFATMKF
jgi:hypothetical protein